MLGTHTNFYTSFSKEKASVGNFICGGENGVCVACISFFFSVYTSSSHCNNFLSIFHQYIFGLIKHLSSPTKKLKIFPFHLE
mmetsp:Transcript_22952/g.29312  ORF Transcript_22952/g.29312 Transcript_22952/m.29312 type:complete len:82 (-) Transcript_22952:22-267(-)